MVRIFLAGNVAFTVSTVELVRFVFSGLVLSFVDVVPFPVRVFVGRLFCLMKRCMFVIDVLMSLGCVCVGWL